MSPIIGRDTFNIAELAESQREFHLAFGQALGQWALIEERLSYWFEAATRMPYKMARAMFFSPRSFSARADILEAALSNNFVFCHCSLEFIKAATKKTGNFSKFRNRLAHGEQSFDARKDSPTFKQTILISGKDIPETAADNAVTIARLNEATAYFRELARLLMDVFEFVSGQRTPDTPVECLRLLNELPNQVGVQRPSA
jgi:hypothetical protein